MFLYNAEGSGHRNSVLSPLLKIYHHTIEQQPTGKRFSVVQSNFMEKHVMPSIFLFLLKKFPH